jgi:hypothetical protein
LVVVVVVKSHTVSPTQVPTPSEYFAFDRTIADGATVPLLVVVVAVDAALLVDAVALLAIVAAPLLVDVALPNAPPLRPVAAIVLARVAIALVAIVLALLAHQYRQTIHHHHH